MREIKMRKRIITIVFGLAILLLAFPIQASAAVKPKKIAISAKSKTMYVGQKYTLKVKSVSPATASNQVTWKSSYSRSASVSQSGTVTAKRSGIVKITATSKAKESVKAVCRIKVKYGIKNKSMKLNKTSATVYEGKTINLNISKWSPSNTTSKSVSWTSSNNTVASVNSSGKVTGKVAGTTVITATNTYGKKVSCKVTVKYIVATKISISTSALRLYKGDVYPGLKATVYPSNAKYKEVTFISQNPLVATVDPTGKITAVGRGTTDVIISHPDGLTQQLTVTVVELEWVAMTKTQTATQSEYSLSSNYISEIQVKWNVDSPFIIDLNKTRDYLKKEHPQASDLADADWTSVTTESDSRLFMKDNGLNKPTYYLRVKLVDGKPEKYTLVIDNTEVSNYDIKPYEKTYTSIVTE
jgi:uncharacterized protein YjdB